MGTTLSLRSSTYYYTRHALQGGAPTMNGASESWSNLVASYFRVTIANQRGLNTTLTKSTVNGPTTGIHPGPVYYDWISLPFTTTTTISGSITFSISAYQSNVLANATVGIKIQRVDKNSQIQETIIDSVYGTALGTTIGIVSWSATPTPITVYKGERVRIVPYFKDANSVTMASGYTVYLGLEGTTATYDSVVTFNETFHDMWSRNAAGATLVLRPSGSTVPAESKSFPTAIAVTPSKHVLAISARGALTQEGEVYIYSGSNLGSNYTQTQIITSSSALNGVDWRGTSLDISDDGTYIIIGVPRTTGYPGRVEIYSGSTATGYTLKTILSGSAGGNTDYFGTHVACSPSADTIYVTAPSGSSQPSKIYKISGSNWNLQTYTTLSYYPYEFSYAKDAAIIAVGNITWQNPSTVRVGKSYLYSASTFELLRELSGSFGPATGSNNLYGLGTTISRDGSTVIIGSINLLPNAVYIYTGANWDTVTMIPNPAVGDYSYFGNKITCSNDGSIIYVAGHRVDLYGPVGSIAEEGFIAKLSGTNWQKQLHLIPLWRWKDSYQFGVNALATTPDGTMLIAGSINDSNNDTNANTGAVYIWNSNNILYFTDTDSDVSIPSTIVKRMWTTPGTN